MDSKTKFLVSIVVLAAIFGIGMSYYKYIVLKDIDLYYIEEEGGETDKESLEEEPFEADESEGETSEVMGTASDEEGAVDELVIEPGIELLATSSATTTTSEL